MISSSLWLFSQNHNNIVLYYNAYISHILNIAPRYGETLSITIYIKWKKILRCACRIILGRDYVTLEDVLKYLSFLTFEETIFINKAKLIYKIANNTAPIKPKLNIFKRSLSYSCVLVWNSIPTEIKKCGHIKQFCFKMFNWLK